jgi:uncharacterized protein YneF (UPF0154 family)|tara:strand:+ start:354 stop:491 length:138 start_codon:yes stop_codon:yes gene_type:complete
MWKWIKKLFKKKNPINDDTLDKMSKGDRKKLKSEGKINSIYKPYY